MKLDKLDFDEEDDFEDSDASKRSYKSEQPQGGGDFWEEIDTKFKYQPDMEGDAR